MTYLVISVLHVHEQEVKELVRTKLRTTVGTFKQIQVTDFYFHDWNDTEVGIEETLTNSGIAWNRHIDTEVTRLLGYSRFNENGEHIFFEHADIQANPDLNNLMELIDEPEVLVDFIKAHHKAVTPLPWDLQVEYGRRYRMLNLITPTDA